MTSSKAFNALTLIACALILVFAVVRMFGTTVSSKYSSAAQVAVASEVSFGGDFAPRAVVANRAPSSPNIPTVTREAVPSATLTEVDALSTFAIDVDTGSYTLSRNYIEDGSLPGEHQVRPEEFINYFRYDYAAPPTSKTATVHFEGAPSPFQTKRDTYLLRIGLQARHLEQRPPVHVTFLVDTSGSMSSTDRLPLAKEAMKLAVRHLRPTDTVGIVTYSGSAEVVLDGTRAAFRPLIDRAIDGLVAGGSTAMSSGMQLAYRTAAEYAGPGRVSRVVVMSDGDANIGHTSPEAIRAELRSWTDDGVTLSTIGFGMGNYRDRMMEQLADAGDGNYAYLDSRVEVERQFSDRLESMLHIVAKDVKVQVEFNSRAVTSWRQIGYENRAMADRDFRNDAADAGELGAGHQATALYEVTLAPGVAPDAELARVRFRHKKPDEFSASEAEFSMTARHLRYRMGDASADFRFQSAVAAFAEALRGRDGVSWGWIEEVASNATQALPEREGFLELVRATARIEGRM